jgi:hypothetical protein
VLEQPVDLGAGGYVGGQDHCSPTGLVCGWLGRLHLNRLPTTIPGELPRRVPGSDPNLLATTPHMARQTRPGTFSRRAASVAFPVIHERSRIWGI